MTYFIGIAIIVAFATYAEGGGYQQYYQQQNQQYGGGKKYQQQQQQQQQYYQGLARGKGGYGSNSGGGGPYYGNGIPPRAVTFTPAPTNVQDCLVYPICSRYTITSSGCKLCLSARKNDDGTEEFSVIEPSDLVDDNVIVNESVEGNKDDKGLIQDTNQEESSNNAQIVEEENVKDVLEPKLLLLKNIRVSKGRVIQNADGIEPNNPTEHKDEIAIF